MDKSAHALTEHEVFLRELIALYRQKPVLWQQKHPQYRNRTERAEAFNALVNKAREYYPEADEDYVRTKIESMRTSFRKERRKVLQSKADSDNPEDVHKPSLWYYDLLLFTVGEETENIPDIKAEMTAVLSNPEHGQTVKIPFWTREQTAMLINLYKNQPCLFSTSHPLFKNKRKRVEAVRKITEKLKEATGKLFLAEDVRRKISLIRGQFLHEYKKIKASERNNENYTPSLWCYEMLRFLEDEYTNNNRKHYPKNSHNSILHHRSRQKNSSSENSEDEDVDIKKESDASSSAESVNLDSSQLTHDDIFETIGKNLAHKLREMTEEQRAIANKIVRDVMYHGQMEHLNVNSRLSLDGV